jgi:hypothetical protein
MVAAAIAICGRNATDEGECQKSEREDSSHGQMVKHPMCHVLPQVKSGAYLQGVTRGSGTVLLR